MVNGWNTIRIVSQWQSDVFKVGSRVDALNTQLYTNRGVQMYLILAVIFIIVTSLAMAQPEGGALPTKLDLQLSQISKAADKCFESASTNVERKECNGEKLSKSDSLLNQIYKDRVSSLKKRIELEKNSEELFKTAETTLDRLVAAQKAWITFRDADCDLQGADLLNGSGEGIIVLGCLAEKTYKRVREIASTGTGEE